MVSVVNHIVVDRMCPEENIDGITYEETLAGETVTLACPGGAEGSITRECALSGDWNDPVNTCGTKQPCCVMSSAELQSRSA